MMKCPACGTDQADENAFCTACGVELRARADEDAQPTDDAVRANPAARRVRAGFGILMLLMFLLVAAVGILTPAQHSPVAPPASVVPTPSVEVTAPPVDPDRAAVEAAIRGFYGTIDAGRPVTKSAYVYPKGTGGPAPRAVEASGTTAFSIARAVIGSGTADVYGRESRSVIATTGAEVEFRLRHVEGEWLISSWQVARETTLAPQALSLSDVTSRDVVGTLLQAYQVGDVTTLELLTTEAFRARHNSWLDGSDRSALLSSWRIVSTRPEGNAYLVTVEEQLLPEPLTATYTVVLTNREILVDAVNWK
jgi:hypothetical protein